MLLTEGLCPSDSPTRALARRSDGSLRARGSLARLVRVRVRGPHDTTRTAGRRAAASAGILPLNWCALASPRSELQPVHQPVIVERDPATRDAVDEPQADDGEGKPRDDDADAEGHDHEQHAQRDPEQSIPERADLPPEVRL